MAAHLYQQLKQTVLLGAACTQWYPLSHATWSPLLGPQWLARKSGTASHAISITRGGGRGFNTLTTVHSNLLAPLVLVWFLAPKKKERLASTVYTLISS